MRLNLNANIQSYRKRRGLTQEQLAEAMGVSVGAVSKWEKGQSNPDISLIAELADFFGISVDVLLGYEWRHLSMGETVERIRELTRAKRFEEAAEEANKALMKFPNSFEAVYYSGKLFYDMGCERNERSVQLRALELMARAAALVEQNSDPEISYESIQIDISNIYGFMGEYDKAIEQAKRYNFCGVNDTEIGVWLTELGRYEGAIPYLSDNLMICMMRLLSGGMSMVTALGNTGKPAEAEELAVWTKRLVSGLEKPGVPSYVPKAEAVIDACRAVICCDMGRLDEAEGILAQAAGEALRFDYSPDYSCSSLRFYHSRERTFFENGTESAVDMVLHLLEHNDKENNTALAKRWSELVAEQKSRKGEAK